MRGPRIEPVAFGTPGSLGERFAAGDPAATGLLAWSAGGVNGTGASLLPTSCGSASLAAEELGATSAEAADKLRVILAGEGVLVATGQQPCLFLGPLYVLYKTLTAIHLAAQLEQRLGRPALALFWIASDDHDWAEVGTTHVIDSSNELQSFRLDPPAGRARRSVGETLLDDSISGLLRDVWQALPQSEFIEPYIKLFEDAYRPGHRVGQAFGSALSALMRGRELVWLDSAAQPVKRALSPLLTRALGDAAGAEAAVAASTERVREAGFEPQLAVLPAASNVFYDDGTARQRVYVNGTTARIGRSGAERPLADLLEELPERPAAFGPSAALRPIAESCLLPVAASVLGPAEIGYWAQLPGLFDWSGVGMPRSVPRTGWSVIEGKVGKVLEALGIEADELGDGGEEILGRAIRQGRPLAVASALRELGSAQEEAFDRVLEALAEELPGIRGTAEKARAGVRKAIQKLEKGVDGGVRERQAVLRQQVEKAALHLYPGGSPQERVLNPLYYLARFGESFLESLDREVEAAVEQYVARLDGGL